MNGLHRPSRTPRSPASARLRSSRGAGAALLFAAALAAGARPAAAAIRFSAPEYFTTDGGPLGIAVGDVNGDGKPDIVTTNIDLPTISVLLGNGDGTFGPRADFAAGGQ